MINEKYSKHKYIVVKYLKNNFQMNILLNIIIN